MSYMKKGEPKVEYVYTIPSSLFAVQQITQGPSLRRSLTKWAQISTKKHTPRWLK